jgi:A/G-specific adenine glycosylase
MVEAERLRKFQDEVWRYYDAHGRHDLYWRLPDANGEFDPYKIMVSELMLQQTQVNRVLTKYTEFLERFPTVQALAVATLGNVLIAWQGLGYNRRAKFLWQAAQMVVNDLGGKFPHDQKELTKLPGVGMNTAGAIMAYAYDQPVGFIETNIRTVYIHHFFHNQTDVPDKAIEELVQLTLPDNEQGNGSDAAGARQWYWALMDYGTYIKQTHGNKSRASKSYTKQSPFEGSKRKVRGAVLRHLSLKSQSLEGLAELEVDPRLTEVLADLEREGMVREEAGRYSLA